MITAAAAARAILTSLHEVMASRAGAQAKLNQIVDVIGDKLNSEVCSIYLLREGMLELFATRGLNQAAVHVTRMAVGEGLVGTIAANIETLNLAEAAAHPDFAFFPETGEERFHSFAGVPIVRRARAVGVLGVKWEGRRAAGDEFLDDEAVAPQFIAELEDRREGLGRLIRHAVDGIACVQVDEANIPGSPENAPIEYSTPEVLSLVLTAPVPEKARLSANIVIEAMRSSLSRASAAAPMASRVPPMQ